MTNTTHDPSTDLLPGGWTIDRLDAVVEVLDSRRKPVNAKERAERPGTIPYFGATGQVGTIDEALFDEPLVLLGEDGVQFFDPNKSKAYEIDGPTWVNNHAHVLRPDEGKIPRTLLVHYLNQFDYRGSANGTTRLKLTQKAMNAIPVVLPPPVEQEQIVEILEAHLSRLDAALQHIQTLRDKAAQFRRSLLHAAFTGALTGHDPSTSELPDGWEPCALGDLLTLKSGFAYKSRDWQDHGIPVVKIANVRNGQVSLTECSFVSCAIADETAQFGVISGDLLMTLTGEIGAIGIYREEEPARLNQRVARLDLRDGGEIAFEFLVLLLQSPTVRGPLWDLAHGMAQPNISPKRVAELPLSLPPRPEQERIVEILEAHLSRLDAALAAADVVEERASALRRSLLHAAFTGKLTEKWREQAHV